MGYRLEPAYEDRLAHRLAPKPIQFFVIDCVKSMTAPRPDDSHHGTLMSPDLGWKIETTWNWLLQTMLA